MRSDNERSLLSLIERVTCNLTGVELVLMSSPEGEWNIFPGFTTMQLVQEVQKFMNKMSEPRTIPRTKYLLVDVQ